MTLRHRLAQGDLLGTTGLVASSGSAAHRTSAISCWERSPQLQSQTHRNGSAGAGLALVMGQSKLRAKVEAPEHCLKDEGAHLGWGGPRSLHGGTPAGPSPSSGVGEPHAHGAGLELIKLPAPRASLVLRPSWVNLQLRQLPMVHTKGTEGTGTCGSATSHSRRHHITAGKLCSGNGAAS